MLGGWLSFGFGWEFAEMGGRDLGAKTDRRRRVMLHSMGMNGDGSVQAWFWVVGSE